MGERSESAEHNHKKGRLHRYVEAAFAVEEGRSICFSVGIDPAEHPRPCGLCGSHLR